MKTTIVVMTLILSTGAFALTPTTKTAVQSTMKTYVNSLVKQNGFMPVLFEGKVLKLKLKKTDKYPDGFHAGVKDNASLYTSCADFQDASGKKNDIDFLVSKTGSSFSVVQPIVHSINGEKNQYDLAH